ITLKSDYDKLMTERLQAYDDGKQFPNRMEDYHDLSAQVDAKGKELEEFGQINKKAGAANARGLQSRNVSHNDDDFSLANARTDFREDTGRDLTPQQEKVVQKKADVIKKADDATEAATQKAIDAIQKPEAEQEKPTPYIQKIVERVVKRIETEAAAARQRIKARAGNLNALLDPTNIADRAIIGAEYIAHGVEDFGEWSKKMTAELGKMLPEDLKRIYEKAKQFASKIAASEAGGKDAANVIKSFRKPTSKTPVTRQTLSDQLKDFKQGGKMNPDQVKSLWQYAKSAYIDKGERNFHDIFNRIARDLGLSVDDVRRAMAQNQTVSRLLNDAYEKQMTARTLKSQAKIWLKQQAVPATIRMAEKVPRAMFNATVFGHFATWFGTHASQNLFDPTTYHALARDYRKMWSAALSKPQWEAMANDLVRRPNYIDARRAGLNNNPFVRQGDFDTPELTKMSQQMGMGRRGMIGLYTFRQDLFDQSWNKMSAEEKTPEMAKALADDVNHSTGTTTSKGIENPWSNFLLFAPRLISSRFQWEITDPAKAIITKVLKGKNATPEEQKIANRILTRRAIFLGTYATTLAANQMLLSMSGSKQKINYFNPHHADWLAFKGFGMEAKPFSAGMAIARLFANEAKDLFTTPPRNTFVKKLTTAQPDEAAVMDVAKYFRGEASPFSGTMADLGFQTDYSERPLPKQPLRNKPPPSPYWQQKQGEKPYTWPEYAVSKITPIPLSAIVKEGFRNAGANESNASRWTKTIIGSVAQAATGVMVEKDWQAK
ncbi:MAG: hypothetical protein KGL39_25340, partial [Patescibacteria group bacterium]|nr:hypothetical protein [Patescibacteria group bacterium]